MLNIAYLSKFGKKIVTPLKTEIKKIRARVKQYVFNKCHCEQTDQYRSATIYFKIISLQVLRLNPKIVHILIWKKYQKNTLSNSLKQYLNLIPID